MSTRAQLEAVAQAIPSARTPDRLQLLLRSVNVEIARRAGPSVTAAFACECLDRGCGEAVEAPLNVFAVLAATGRHFLVRPEHHDPLGDRIVRQDGGYVVVERAA